MLKVIKSGFYTTIQDTGRFGYRTFGVPVSGAMDSYSSQFANALLGNNNDDALLEITMTGPTLHFLEPTLIAVSGAEMHPKLNDSPIKLNTIISILANDVLSFGRIDYGFRAYLAVKGGFLSDKVLGGRSMFKGMTTDNRVKDNDALDYHSFKGNLKSLNANVKYNNEIIKDLAIDVYKGPEFHKLSANKQKQLLSTTFSVSKLNNRMAYQLEPKIENTLEQILTAPVLPGTIQLTPSGQLIVLMRDCQTTGGYPRVLQLTEKAINILSQKTTGNTLKISLKG